MAKAEDYRLQQDWPKQLLTEDLDALFDESNKVIWGLRQDVFDWINLINPEKIPAELLDVFLLHRGFRLAIDFPGVILTEKEKRKLAVLAVPVYQQKGTAAGIINIIRLLLGIEAAIIVQTNVDRWILDEKELDETTIIGPNPNDPAERRFIYAFEIQIPFAVTQEQEDKIIALVNYMKPIHTHLLGVIVPTDFDHWELDISYLEDTSDLHE